MTEKIKVTIPKSKLQFGSINRNGIPGIDRSCILGHIAVALDPTLKGYTYPDELYDLFKLEEDDIIEKFDSAFINDMKEKQGIDTYIYPNTDDFISFIESLTIEEIKTIAAPTVELLSPFFDIEFIDA